ncbi:MAG: arsenical pump-driving ATPase, partial [Erysipelotrichaceae bacterium]
MMELYNPKHISLTKYLFFTGKGGVGKTSVACATAVTLADQGKQVFLISTDPASNLQDVFGIELSNQGIKIPSVANLTVANLDPIQAAAEYRNRVISPFIGQLPQTVIASMEEQLSGSCTVEIAAFNEFSKLMTAESIQKEFDYIIFDTAPTGHTLRMLQLPSAWTNFIKDSTHGASCLGQLSGLESQRLIYKDAVERLANPALTTLMLVSRPESTPLIEAERASQELAELGVKNQILIINGILESYDDTISKDLYDKQQRALRTMPELFKSMVSYQVPLRAYNITGIDKVRALLIEDQYTTQNQVLTTAKMASLKDMVDDLIKSNKRVIFTMGKGGVGKTSIAAAIALGFAAQGKKVHLSSTDPAAHLKLVMNENQFITMSHIDELKELAIYQDEILSKARLTMSDEEIEYIEEDLQSPCTQEIAVFRKFAEIVEQSEDRVVIIDTAPTGHTLLLLDATQSYHKEIERSQGEIPPAVSKLLPRLRNPKETSVIIVTLAETTPVYEAIRLEEDLKRAGIKTDWWLINASFINIKSTNRLLMAKANHELEWINKVDQQSNGRFVLVDWFSEELKG